MATSSSECPDAAAAHLGKGMVSNGCRLADLLDFIGRFHHANCFHNPSVSTISAERLPPCVQLADGDMLGLNGHGVHAFLGNQFGDGLLQLIDVDDLPAWALALRLLNIPKICEACFSRSTPSRQTLKNQSGNVYLGGC